MRFVVVMWSCLCASCCAQSLPAGEAPPPLTPLPIGWEGEGEEGEGEGQAPAACDTALAEGWRDEVLVSSTGRSSAASSCATFPATEVIVCVIEVETAGAGLDLHQLRSHDSGQTWTAPERITNDDADEHSPYLVADGARGDLKLAYSFDGAGVDLVLRVLPCAGCAFSAATDIIADGGSHRHASLIALDDGALLALEEHQDEVRALRSDDGGASWSSPQGVIDHGAAPLPVRRPVAVQQDGWVQLLFRDDNHGPNGVIAEVWSADGGRSWVEHSVLFDAGADIEVAFAGIQLPGNVTVLATIEGRAHHLTSWDGGITFAGPYATSLRSQTTAATMAVGPFGPVFLYGDGSGDGIFARRYHWGCP